MLSALPLVCVSSKKLHVGILSKVDEILSHCLLPLMIHINACQRHMGMGIALFVFFLWESVVI